MPQVRNYLTPENILHLYLCYTVFYMLFSLCICNYILFSEKEKYSIRKFWSNFAITWPHYKCDKSQNMMELNYDVVVVGAGHAGCEAASAAARCGCTTCLVTMDMNKIAQMSCNPAIGGIAKGQIVREIDALGGFTGIVTDRSAIQFRMLNRSKGPAMWSPRSQCDRMKFSAEWRHILENTDGLDIWQDQVEELIVENGKATGVETQWGVRINAKAVVITAGTFLNGLLHIGRRKVPGGRCAEPAVGKLTESITRHGIRSERMKTGTPVRIDARSIDFGKLEIQEGENDFHRFSYITEKRTLPQLTCWLCSTNEKVHKILRSALDDSPLYNGQIQSIGPRYCPSIETKIVTFPDRNHHPLFLEPEGTSTNEMYLNGFSSSMPSEIQIEAIRNIEGFENAKVYRPGYAIEYDFFDPTQLNHSLESKVLENLFFAGQVNGTTGYEEAAGQGIIAGINAAQKVQGKKPLVLRRDEAYIGVLIDDLTTKGVDEPYRMFTSRAEFRILLRQDNADERLTPRAKQLGTISNERWEKFLKKQEIANGIINYCEKTKIKPKDINDALLAMGTTKIEFSERLEELLNRPQICLDNISEFIEPLKMLMYDGNVKNLEACEAAEVKIKYKGYIERERKLAEKILRLEDIKIRGHFDYSKIKQLTIEARQKLERINPETLAEASRIPGISPSDISVLLILMKR